MNEDINRLKVVLAERKRTNKWLAEQLGKDPATVSKWCTNKSQPGLETLVEISKVLEVDVKELLWPSCPSTLTPRCSIASTTSTTMSGATVMPSTRPILRPHQTGVRHIRAVDRNRNAEDRIAGHAGQ